MKKNDVAVTIQNLVQFYSIKPGIDELIKRTISVTIFVPINRDDSGIGDLFDETYKVLKTFSNKYDIKRKVNKNTYYKVLIEPYPMDIYFKFNFTYRIKFKYSLLSAKPNLVYDPESNIYYDLILCYSKYDADFLSVYAKTCIISPMKFVEFKKKQMNTKKPVLLYLPTYGDVSSIEDILDSLQKLKSAYYIIIKLHHGTSSLKNEKERIDKVQLVADECVDHIMPLSELLSKSDVVLSDNSGAIFEAIYTKIPVAIYSKNINKNKIGNLDTTQYKLVKQDFLPYTDDAKKISEILSLAMSKKYQKKLSIISNFLFKRAPHPGEEFANIISEYLCDSIDYEYKAVHDILLNDFNNKKKYISDLEHDILNKNQQIEELNKIASNNKVEIDELKQRLFEANQQLYYYENGKLYRLCKKIYSINRNNR